VGQVMSRWRAVGAAVRPRFPGVVLAHQVHGTTVRWHPATTDGWLIVDAVDGHATGARGLLLTVTVADCVPVYLAVPQKQVVALLHAGWRGTAGGILERGVELVKRMAFVQSPDIVMHCGVGICGECYEVGSEVLSQFSGHAETGPGHVDLRTALARRGEALGVGAAGLRSRARTAGPLGRGRVGGPPASLAEPAAEPRGGPVADCATASRMLEAWLDGDGPLGRRYMLEVSSPGVERPLRWHRHWVRFVGREVQATVAGLGRVRARIVAVPDEATVVLEPHGGAPRPVRLAGMRDARCAGAWW